MSIAWIRNNYGVPAKRGGRVEYAGRGTPMLGTIVGTNGPHLRIVLDGEKHVMPYHPTWKIRYLDDPKVQP